MTLQGGNRRVLIVGNYRFTGKVLGKGNFARVEEAVHNILNVKVAVKIMDINQIKEDYVIRNLCREAKLMARLNHPCIVSLYQTMQRSDNVYYLVTELAPGGDLCSFIKNQRSGRLEERPTRIYARQFVSALSHMHSLGVVHRDLKMENVMLNSAQTQIKIVDFGLSNFFTPDEPLRTHCGSPEYAAPELFITGKKYGPEVDLWSLGIILYGMIVGQLPFVSNRTEQISSQERRKKLVAQINKGLSTSHRRALAIFSPELRNVISRMLVADKSKRISIKDLLVHPWITEKGTKLIRINPLRKLDVQQQASVIAEICELTRQESDEVISMVKQEPYSKTGGIFNILTHRMASSRLSGDGVTKVTPTLEIDVAGREKSPNKRPYNLRNNSSRRNSKPYEEGSNTDGPYTPRIIVQDKKTSQSEKRKPSTPSTPVQPRVDCRRPSTECRRPSTECRRPTTPISGIRPKTVQSHTTEKRINYKDLKTPYIARKAGSAGITPKTTRPSTVSSPITRKVSKSMDPRIAKDIAKRLCPTGLNSEVRSDKKGPIVETSLRIAPSINGLKLNANTEKSEARRAQTAIDRKQRSKSEKLSGSAPSRPVTAAGAAASGIRKVFGLATTQSDSKTTNKPPKDVNRPFTRFLKSSRPSTCTEPVEKSVLAYGDSAGRNQYSNIHQKLKKPTIYDPIARSIAGYVCNNVPDKLPNLSHFKK